MTKQQTYGIVVSGGPAPGINAVISASVAEARRQGAKIIGFQSGFLGISKRGIESARELQIEDVSYIANTGGSIIGTSRCNPFREDATAKRFTSTLKELDINKLIVIGGEGSAMLSRITSKEVPDISIAHVPKTIDNDIPLPNDQSTFGFDTARCIGTNIVDTLVTDARTCRRWYLVETMGRQAGFLTLGIAVASQTTIAFIPEQFSDKLYHPAELASTITNVMKQRHERGKEYGVAIFAEGILDRLDPEHSRTLSDSPRDELGRITYSELELGQVLLPHIKKQCVELGIGEQTIRTKNIGYELRCAPPISTDIEYGKILGYGAVRCLNAQKGHFMITRNKGNLEYIPLENFLENDVIVGRTIDLNSDLYVMAKNYIRTFSQYPFAQ